MIKASINKVIRVRIVTVLSIRKILVLFLEPLFPINFG